ncbi:MAG: glucose 1-dehydrogenase [Halioglobus sp.]|jgi:NAD(P)-dependent dehydrogenase (short-subunit alcohol dehydrogenase family)
MSTRLEAKVAVITGGASGIGEATVNKFVAEGARVVIADMQVDRGSALAATLGDNAIFIRTDVCIEEQVKAAINIAHTTWGRLDCLFNNAGFGGVTGDIEETDMGEPYQRTVGAMLTGPVLGMKHAAPIMKSQGFGSIITTASIAGTGGGYGPHIYSAVKAAVINLSRSVAQELGPFKVRVNAVCPGFINTPIFAGQLALADRDRDYVSPLEGISSLAQPISRAGLPQDIANAVCFLASDESDFITGHALVVDGGMTLGAWRHPDLGPDMFETIGQVLGTPDLADVDMVYHADTE